VEVPTRTPRTPDTETYISASKASEEAGLNLPPDLVRTTSRVTDHSWVAKLSKLQAGPHDRDRGREWTAADLTAIVTAAVPNELRLPGLVQSQPAGDEHQQWFNEHSRR
jgi:hypothetical protein